MLLLYLYEPYFCKTVKVNVAVYKELFLELASGHVIIARALIIGSV